MSQRDKEISRLIEHLRDPSTEVISVEIEAEGGAEFICNLLKVSKEELMPKSKKEQELIQKIVEEIIGQ